MYYVLFVVTIYKLLKNLGLEHCALRKAFSAQFKLLTLPYLSSCKISNNVAWVYKNALVLNCCIVDVLWCQQIELIQVVSTSEFHEYWWNDVDLIFFHPLHLVQGLRSLEHWLLQKLSVKNFDQKFRFFIKK